MKGLVFILMGLTLMYLAVRGKGSRFLRELSREV